MAPEQVSQNNIGIELQNNKVPQFDGISGGRGGKILTN